MHLLLFLPNPLAPFLSLYMLSLSFSLCLWQSTCRTHHPHRYVHLWSCVLYPSILCRTNMRPTPLCMVVLFA